MCCTHVVVDVLVLSCIVCIIISVFCLLQNDARLVLSSITSIELCLSTNLSSVMYVHRKKSLAATLNDYHFVDDKVSFVYRKELLFLVQKV